MRLLKIQLPIPHHQNVLRFKRDFLCGENYICIINISNIGPIIQQKSSLCVAFGACSKEKKRNKIISSDLCRAHFLGKSQVTIRPCAICAKRIKAVQI
jgi:hypothetical protein